MPQAKSIHSVQIRKLYDTDPDPSYLEQEGFEDRLDQYRRGLFCYIGVRAECEIVVNGVIQTITSGGLWGIEDDSDASYLQEVGAEELSQLRETLHGLGFGKRAVSKACKGVTL